MKDYAVIAYATNNMAHCKHMTFWEYADRLESELMKHGHRAHIVRYGAAATRNDGLVVKGTFIRQSLEELRKPVLYLDVDSKLVGPLGGAAGRGMGPGGDTGGHRGKAGDQVAARAVVPYAVCC